MGVLENSVSRPVDLHRATSTLPADVSDSPTIDSPAARLDEPGREVKPVNVIPTVCTSSGLRK